MCFKGLCGSNGGGLKLCDSSSYLKLKLGSEFILLMDTSGSCRSSITDPVRCLCILGGRIGGRTGGAGGSSPPSSL